MEKLTIHIAFLIANLWKHLLGSKSLLMYLRYMSRDIRLDSFTRLMTSIDAEVMGNIGKGDKNSLNWCQHFLSTGEWSRLRPQFVQSYKNEIQMAASNQWDVIPCIFYATECIIWRLGYFKAIKSAWQQILPFFDSFAFAPSYCHWKESRLEMKHRFSKHM